IEENRRKQNRNRYLKECTRDHLPRATEFTRPSVLQCERESKEFRQDEQEHGESEEENRDMRATCIRVKAFAQRSGAEVFQTPEEEDQGEKRRGEEGKDAVEKMEAGHRSEAAGKGEGPVLQIALAPAAVALQVLDDGR